MNIAHVVALRLGFVMGMPRSFKICFSQMASHAITVVPLYLALVLHNMTIMCFLLLHNMASLLMEKKKLDVDRLSAL